MSPLSAYIVRYPPVLVKPWTGGLFLAFLAMRQPLDITIGYFFILLLNFPSLVRGRGMCYPVVKKQGMRSFGLFEDVLAESQLSPSAPLRFLLMALRAGGR